MYTSPLGGLRCESRERPKRKESSESPPGPCGCWGGDRHLPAWQGRCATCPASTEAEAAAGSHRVQEHHLPKGRTGERHSGERTEAGAFLIYVDTSVIAAHYLSSRIPRPPRISCAGHQRLS